MNPSTSFVADVLIVGSGAGGSAAAYRLIQDGYRVCLLEKGGELPDDGSTMDPKLVTTGHFNSKEQWIDARRRRRFKPEEHFDLGGKTRWYGAALLRIEPAQFQPDARLGLLPWPIGYAELAPYYDEAEALLGVRTFANEPDLQRLLTRFTAAGWTHRSMPMGLSADIAEHPYEQTHYDGFAVPGGQKADARHRLIDRIRDHASLRIELQAEVTALLPDPADPRRIAGVRCTDGREFRAATVLLSAGAMHSPRLLQHYLEESGLARTLPAAAAVGRNYKRHILTAVIAFGWRIKTDRTRKTALLQHADFPHGSAQPLGGWADRETIRTMLRPWLPRWLVEFFALRAYGLFLQTEDGSDPANRVIAGSDGAPPTLDYDLARMPVLAREHRRLVRSVMGTLLRAGLFPFKQTIGLQGTAHCVGTLVAGTDPAVSVVDAHGKVHGLDNLYVADGSVIPRVSPMNPALTIYAWGLRLASKLTAHRERGPGRSD